MGEISWVHTAIGLLAISVLGYLLFLVKSKPFFKEMGWGCMLLSLLCLTVSLVIRSKNAEYFALSNMYESLLVLCMCTQLAFLVMDRWFNLKSLGFPASLLLLGALVYDLTLPTDIHPLQAALQSYWRSIHVPVILMSYALFTLAFLSSVVHLVKEAFQGKNGGGGTLTPAYAGADDGKFSMEELAAMESGQTAVSNHALDLSTELDSGNIYDEITYRCVAFGFPLLAIGIILGGMWANEAWGNYWSWDPKESMSLVTLLGYGVYLHMRVNGEHSARTLSIVSVAGFILMLITYFGVNLMGLGLHSYGKIG